MKLQTAWLGLDLCARGLTGGTVEKCCIMLQHHDMSIMMVQCAAAGRGSA